MKAKEMIIELQRLIDSHGDIVVQLQNDPKLDELVVSYPDFFIVAEEYLEDGWIINLRTWPY